MEKYDHKKIEPKWQKEWADANIFKTSEEKDKPKCYVLDMFPYPSGSGLHTGHTRIYTASDVYARMKRAQGFNVLHPTGWDAFGLPAEQFAMKNKIHPSVAVKKNTDCFREQMKAVGFSYDWEREISTADPKFYKWTQWTFLKMLEKGLAYESYEPIIWCPSCQTGLANEDLEGNVCERCGTIVEQKPMRQWVLKITDYAERLLSDIDVLQWPESIKESQKNWIGKSEGAELTFATSNGSEFKVFTTRPDTLFGATYCVIAPEHKLLDDWKGDIKNWVEVEKYRAEMKKKTEIERTAEGKEKTGVKLEGVTAKNPVNGDELPIFISDYVLAHYGTGAVMAVPAHDERDYAFAKKFGLPIKTVIEPITGEKRENEELRKSIVAIVHNKKNDTFLSINWGEKLGGNLFVGGGREGNEDPIACAVREIEEETGYKNAKHISSSEMIHHHYVAFSKGVNRNIDAVGLYFELVNEDHIATKHEEDEKGKFSVQWITRDDAKNKIKDELHVLVFERLVEEKAYVGRGQMVNSGKFDGMENVDAKKAIAEFAGGHMKTTYKLRDWTFSRQRYWGEPIPVVHCKKDGVVPIPEKELPLMLPDVEFYEPSGTGESPLVNIRDWVETTCPKCGGPAERETNTMPQWAGSSWYYLRFIDPKNETTLVDKEKEKYWSPVDMYVGGMEHATRHLIYARFWHKFLFDIGAVNYSEPFTRLESVGLVLGEGGVKMSKRLGNVVNPTDVVENYGADTLRVYEMFMGPFDQSCAWSTESIIGPRRFLEKIWKISEKVSKDAVMSGDVETHFHQTIKKVAEDIDAFKFNTAVSQLMIFVNELDSCEKVSQEMFEGLLKLMTPFAPHMTEELWHNFGHTTFIYNEAWPKFDAWKLQEAMMTIAIQINGKLRDTILVPSDKEEDVIKDLALASKKVAEWTKGKEIKKVIYVKGRLVSIVV
jgi:leucyl-tRNA synthetase